MPKKSNKTEQVLRLITKTNDKDDTAEAEKITEEIAVQSPKETDIVEEEAVSEENILEENDSEEETKEISSQRSAVQEVKPAVHTEVKPTPSNEIKDEPVPEENIQPMKYHRVSPPVVRDNDIKIVNLSELMVKDLMYDVIRKLNVCDCSLCKADIMALTLNKIPQKYVTTEEGKQVMQLDMYRKQYETDVLSALTRACVRVKGSPRHN